MAPVCQLCQDAESKYKCPTCGLRYCSITCYKPHKAAHQAETPQDEVTHPSHAVVRIDRPGTTQRVVKPKFDGFETEEEFQRLLLRYPALKTELQGIFALTMDPGPDEARSWNKMSLPLLDRPTQTAGRGGRGRGRGFRGRGAYTGAAKSMQYEAPEGREHGQWTRDKGDREALYVMKKVQHNIGDDDLAEGMQEFVQLVRMRFGDQRET